MYYKLEKGVNRVFAIINENEFEIKSTNVEFVKKIDTTYYDLALKNKLATNSNGGFPFFEIKNYHEGFTSIFKINNSKNYIISTMNDGCFFMDSNGIVDYKNRMLLGKKIPEYL